MAFLLETTVYLQQLQKKTVQPLCLQSRFIILQKTYNHLKWIIITQYNDVLSMLTVLNYT